jgi:uncharacterized membrane protein
MSYLIWKLVHVASVIIFLGNIINGLFWAAQANKTSDFKMISSTFQGIIKSDRYFTIPGIIGITAAGIMCAIHGKIPILTTAWIFWSIILFSISGVFFSIYISPLQKKVFSFTSTTPYSVTEWNAYQKLYRKWEVWRYLATIAPVAAMIIMVLKPSIPGL